MKYILSVGKINKEFKNLAQVEKFGKTFDNATVFGAPLGGKVRKKMTAKNLKVIFKSKDIANISLNTDTDALSVSMKDGTLKQIEENMDAIQKIDRYLAEKKAVEKEKGDFESPDDLSPDDQEDLMDMMLDLIFDLDDEQITDKQAEIIQDIIDILDDDLDNDSVDEVFKIRKRRDLGVKRKRRREYRRKRSSRKLRAKKYRRSAKGKMTARKAKRKGKFGRTSTGKRQRKFIGPDLKR